MNTHFGLTLNIISANSSKSKSITGSTVTNFLSHFNALKSASLFDVKGALEISFVVSLFVSKVVIKYVFFGNWLRYCSKHFGFLLCKSQFLFFVSERMTSNTLAMNSGFAKL